MVNGFPKRVQSWIGFNIFNLNDNHLGGLYHTLHVTQLL